MDMKWLIADLKRYADIYEESNFGISVPETAKLIRQAADIRI